MPEFELFWTDRHLCTLTTPRRDGSPHVVPVGATLDLGTMIARVITSISSQKARNVAAAGPDGARVALCQVDGRTWSTIEGTAVLRTESEQVSEAERRYTERYGRPRPNPRRVVIEIRVTRLLGTCRPA